jgi:hypothetical protein
MIKSMVHYTGRWRIFAYLTSKMRIFIAIFNRSRQWQGAQLSMIAVLTGPKRMESGFG